jgi:hypothetical protein
MVGQSGGFCLLAYQIPDVLTRTVRELSAPDAEAAVVIQRHRHQPNPSEAAAFFSRRTNHVKPALHPGQVIRLTSQKPS